MPKQHKAHLGSIVLSLAPYSYATRTRKAAQALREVGTVRFLAPSAVGRTEQRVSPGHQEQDGVTTWHAPIAAIVTSPTVGSGIRNLLRCYLPAFVRLGFQAMRTPASLVYVTGAALSPIAALHKLVFGSFLVLDINERPGLVDVKGSVYSWFSRVELKYLSVIHRMVDVVCLVTPGHVSIIRDLGFSQALVIRNAPLLQWFNEAAPGKVIIGSVSEDEFALRLVCIGTITRGRAYIELVEAVALARASGAAVTVDLYGPANPEFLVELELAMTRSYSGSQFVRYCGTLADADVAGTYAAYDMGVAIYDPTLSASDSLSNKIIECVASGTPVLAGDLPENRVFMDETKAGLIVPVESTAMAQALVEVTETDVANWRREARLVGPSLNWENEFAPVLRAAAAAANHSSARHTVRFSA